MQIKIGDKVKIEVDTYKFNGLFGWDCEKNKTIEEVEVLEIITKEEWDGTWTSIKVLEKGIVQHYSLNDFKKRYYIANETIKKIDSINI